ncbi:MAG: hypothetical protein H0X25_24090 [Acidobacteriales bacterium]|nr:hypothetical protein [Terriglobales bacterium]
MIFLLTIAGIAGGIFWFVLVGHRDQLESFSEPRGAIDDNMVTAFDIAASTSLQNLPAWELGVLDCPSKDKSSYDDEDIYDLNDRFNRDIQDANWLIDTFLFDERTGIFDNSASDDTFAHDVCFNFATSLPMMSDCELGFDVDGNLYGFGNDELLNSSDLFESDIGMGSFGSDDAFDWGLGEQGSPRRSPGE